MKKKFNPKAKRCPECGANWVSSIIPKESREYYSPPYFFSRLIGMYDMREDRTMYYVCPDCKTKFER